MVMFWFLNESYYMFVYWIVGVFFDDIEILMLVVSIVWMFESVGFCILFGIGVVKVLFMVNFVILFVMFGFIILVMLVVVFMVLERLIDLCKVEVGGILEGEIGSVGVSEDFDEKRVVKV